ncbi:MAG: ribosomal-protein-alanine N-acetyltransferase, partial [Chloroflexi bacterium]|nr:ribosomal-protein-alanine N-acetyltransferase [Chloroflexota bacterium]
LREAQRRSAIFATLEVRVSNTVAQNLYRKYGFSEIGRRKRYYRDNDEDALIMTVENFVEPEYRAQLDALERALREKLARQAT